MHCSSAPTSSEGPSYGREYSHVHYRVYQVGHYEGRAARYLTQKRTENMAMHIATEINTTAKKKLLQITRVATRARGPGALKENPP